MSQNSNGPNPIARSKKLFHYTGVKRGWKDPLVSIAKSKLSSLHTVHIAKLGAILFSSHIQNAQTFKTFKMLRDHDFAICVFVCVS